MTLTNALILTGVGAFVVLGGAWAARRHLAQDALLEARVASLTRTTDSLAAREVKAETTFVHDTVRLARWLVRYDTARVRDTVTVDSVVYVERAVADSTVHACTMALNACELGWALARERGDSLVALSASLTKLRPTFWSRLGVYVGYGIVAEPGGTFAHGAQVGVGVRVWP